MNLASGYGGPGGPTSKEIGCVAVVAVVGIYLFLRLQAAWLAVLVAN